MPKYSYFIAQITILLFLFTLNGCLFSSNSAQKEASEIPLPPTSQPAKLEISEFILGSGDAIDIEVFRTPHSESVLWTGDTVEINLFRNPDYRYTLRVGSDGLLTLPFVGDFQAAGSTIPSLRNKITKGLSKYFVDPQVSVNILPNRELRIVDLAASLTVGSSGKIIYPVIGDIQATGKSIFTLRDEIEKELAKNFIEPKVSITLTSMRSQKYLVLGEVVNPGAYNLTTDTSVLSAIAQAGGPTGNAKQTNVLLIRNTGEESEVISIELGVSNKSPNNLNPRTISVKKDDIIYVAEKRIASISRFMAHIAQILKPFVSLETGIVLWPQVIDTLEGNDPDTSVSVTN